MTTIDMPTTTTTKKPAFKRQRHFSGPRPTVLHIVLTVLLYAFFAVFLIWPIAQIVKTGFYSNQHMTFIYIRMIFQDPMLVRGLLNAAGIAIAVTALTLAVALPLAVLSVRFDFPGRRLLSGLLLVPLVLPPFVGAIGMRLVFGRFGTLTQLVGGGGPMGIDWLGHYKVLGIVIVEALHLYPIMLLNLQAALANTDPAMQQAAANLGAGRLRIFRRITLPLIRPGLFAGCTLTLIWSFTELGTPLMFEFYTITPVQVFRQITDVADNPLPYALVVVMLVASSTLYLVGKGLLGRGCDSDTTKASTANAPKQLYEGWGLLAALPFLIVFLMAVLPHLSVVMTSLCQTGQWYKTLLPHDFTLAHYRDALLDEQAMPSVRNSLHYASLAMWLAMAVGLAAAIVIVRSNVPGRGIIDALAMLPLAVPGIVLAFGYLAISVALRNPKTGQWSTQWLNVQEQPIVFLVIAYAARRLPYVVRAAVAGLQQTPPDLERAAGNLGAGRFTVLRRITIPLILANLIAGGLLAFTFSMLEVSDSLVLAQRAKYYPITKAIWELSQRLGDGVYIASALGVWAMVLLTLTILASNSLLGKKMGAIFRI